MNKENELTEFKRELTNEIKKEVVAFVNSYGGDIYIGVEDNGTVCGVENPDEVMLQISGKLRDSILPDVIPFLRITTEVIDGKNVVKVSVSSGTNKPYYIQEKGIKPSGVYVRVGSYFQPLSNEGIMQMILKYYGTSFEVGRSINQNLTFNTLIFYMTKKVL